MKKLVTILLLALSMNVTVSASTASSSSSDRRPRYEQQDRKHHKDHFNKNTRGRGQRSGYMVTRNGVFYEGHKVKNARPSSFTIIGGGYARDNKHVYYYGRKIDDAKASSFRILADGYSADHKHVYYRGQKVRKADSRSFQVLRNGYARDHRRTYYRGQEARRPPRPTLHKTHTPSPPRAPARGGLAALSHSHIPAPSNLNIVKPFSLTPLFATFVVSEPGVAPRRTLRSLYQRIHSIQPIHH